MIVLVLYLLYQDHRIIINNNRIIVKNKNEDKIPDKSIVYLNNIID